MPNKNRNNTKIWGGKKEEERKKRKKRNGNLEVRPWYGRQYSDDDDDCFYTICIYRDPSLSLVKTCLRGATSRLSLKRRNALSKNHAFVPLYHRPPWHSSFCRRVPVVHLSAAFPFLGAFWPPGSLIDTTSSSSSELRPDLTTLSSVRVSIGNLTDGIN